MRWNNFHVWRGRLPHWRADDVRYYVTFRHRRALDDAERRMLLSQLLRPEGKKWDLEVVCVLPEVTEMIFTVRTGKNDEPFELSDILEKAKTKAGKLIIKKSGERFPPLYNESYDRIIRDDAEFEERWQAIVGSPVDHEFVDDPSDYESLWVLGAS